MTSIEALVPIIVVVMLGSEFIVSPFKLQEIDIGKSPWDTEHINCACDPSSMISEPKLNGTILGGSVNKNK